MAGARLPEHSHCKFCGDPVPFGQDYCDERCRVDDMEREAGEKHKEILFYVSAIVVIIALAAIRMLI